ncbi:MAG: hypothetical protein AAF432_12155 [Planctomycetota bacterium]
MRFTLSALAVAGAASMLHAGFEPVDEAAVSQEASSNDGAATAVTLAPSDPPSIVEAAVLADSTNDFGQAFTQSDLSQFYFLNESGDDSSCTVVLKMITALSIEADGSASAHGCLHFDGFDGIEETVSETVSPDGQPSAVISIVVSVTTFDLPYPSPLVADHLLNLNLETTVENGSAGNQDTSAFAYGGFFSYGDTSPELGQCTLDFSTSISNSSVFFSSSESLCASVGGVYTPPSPLTANEPLQSYRRTIRMVGDQVIEDTTTTDLDLLNGASCEGIGACCVPTLDECLHGERADDCESMGGVYQGDATLCSQVVCPPLGACCDPDNGSCSIVFDFDCDAMGGVFQGDDVACNPSPCPPAGACCFGDSCEVLTEASCESNGGCYFGDNTSCGNISSGGVNLMIPEDGTTLSHTIHAPNIGTVDDMRVFVNIDQQNIAGLLIELERDGVFVTLYDGDCNPDSDDIRARFVDGGTPIADGCMVGSLGLDSPPGFDPVGSLSDFDGLPIGGEWTLHITNDELLPCGELNRWRLIFPNVPDFECIDCNMNGVEDSCETEPLLDPMFTEEQDLCIDAQPLDNDLTEAGDTTGASSDAFLFCGPFFSLFDQYFSYVPRSDGEAFIVVDDFGPEVFMISVHTGCPATEGNMIACTANNLTGLYVPVERGVGYIVRVAGLNQDRGAYEITLHGPALLRTPVDDNLDGVPDECECRADVNGDGTVDALDFIQAMNEQGNCILSPPGCPSDVNQDGTVDNLDLALIINNWGPCPFPQMMMNPAFQPRSFKGEAVGDELMDSGKRRK